MAGDIVLKTVANELEEHFNKPGDMVCRYGGEEFCVLLPDCSKEEAMEMANAFRKKIELHEIVLRRQKTHPLVCSPTCSSVAAARRQSSTTKRHSVRKF